MTACFGIVGLYNVIINIFVLVVKLHYIWLALRNCLPRVMLYSAFKVMCVVSVIHLKARMGARDKGMKPLN